MKAKTRAVVNRPGVLADVVRELRRTFRDTVRELVDRHAREVAAYDRRIMDLRQRVDAAESTVVRQALLLDHPVKHLVARVVKKVRELLKGQGR